MKTIRILLSCVLALFVNTALAASSGEELEEIKDQIEALQSGQQAIQKELAEIKTLLQQGQRGGAPTPPPFEKQDVTLGASPFLGEPDATVTMVEYSDYQCPFCARHYRNVMPTLVKDYVDTGKLKYVMRENPIPSLHAQAFNASLAALCAGDQGQYWEMHNRLFDNQRTLNPDLMKSFAADMGLDTKRFDKCLDNREFESQVNEDIASGERLGVRGTPGFILGLTSSEDSNTFHAVRFIRGAQSLDGFRRTIDDLIESAKADAN